MRMQERMLKRPGHWMAIACLISVPLGLWLGHIGKGGFLAINVSNVGRAVPSLALIAFFVAYLGVGFTNLTLALVLLAIPPILTNAYFGIDGVDRDVVEAARGMGLTDRQVLTQVELPLALPLVFPFARRFLFRSAPPLPFPSRSASSSFRSWRAKTSHDARRLRAAPGPSCGWCVGRAPSAARSLPLVFRRPRTEGGKPQPLYVPTVPGTA